MMSERRERPKSHLLVILLTYTPVINSVWSQLHEAMSEVSVADHLKGVRIP
jgi:hypothetical protein